MGAPLALRSEVGRGTVFTLELPVGKAPRVAERAIGAKAPAGRHARRAARSSSSRTKPAVREGLEVLLNGWGATIVAFDSVAAVRAWADGAAAATAPSLVIADYRLEEGETGVAAIAALRRRFGASSAGDRRHRQQHDRPRQGSGRARLPPADQARAAEQAARDDRVQAVEVATLSGRWQRPPPTWPAT